MWISTKGTTWVTVEFTTEWGVSNGKKTAHGKNHIAWEEQQNLVETCYET